MNILCRFGIHKYVGIMLMTASDHFGHPYVFGIGACKRCNRCQIRFLPPPSPGDAVDWALKFEADAKRDGVQ